MSDKPSHEEIDTRYNVPIRLLSDLDQIAKIPLENARYTYDDGDATHLVLDSLIVPRTSDTLIVVFHALADRAKVQTPHFQFLSTLSGRDESLLFLADPGLEVDPMLESTWYIGSESDALRARLIRFIDAVRSRVSAKYVVLMGLGAGGFAALSYSFDIDNSVALAFAPQSDIRRYYGGRWAALVKSAFPNAASPEGVFADDPGRVDLLSLYSRRPMRNSFIYWQNTMDRHHVENHYLPFAASFGLGLDGGISPDERAVFIHEYEGEGHICPERPKIHALISQAKALAKSLYTDYSEDELNAGGAPAHVPSGGRGLLRASLAERTLDERPRLAEPAAKVLDVSLVRLAEDSALRRMPLRPMVEWTESFWKGFDNRTVFVDAFQVGPDVMLVGPALENLAIPLQNAVWRCDGAEITTPDIADAHLINITRLKNVGPVQSVMISGDGFELGFRVNPNFRDLFRGRKAILTVSKDNPLIWIKDWLKFHHDHHGTDAVLIIDNGSTAYTMEELRAALASVPGIAIAVVVQIDIPYGPGPNASGRWDANYFQFTAIEYARWKFLTHAAGVIQGDIDELILTDDGRSIYEHAADDGQGVCCYYGRFFERIDEPREETPRHRDVVHYDPDTKRSGSKWTVIPERNPDHFQWLVHSVRGYSKTVDDVLMRHLMLINTGWKYKYAPVRFDPKKHLLDAELADALAESFAD